MRITFINTYRLVSSSFIISNTSFFSFTYSNIFSNSLTILRPLIDYLVETLYITIKIYT